jgi:hypothetical protein
VYRQPQPAAEYGKASATASSWVPRIQNILWILPTFSGYKESYIPIPKVLDGKVQETVRGKLRQPERRTGIGALQLG